MIFKIVSKTMKDLDITEEHIMVVPGMSRKVSYHTFWT